MWGLAWPAFWLSFHLWVGTCWRSHPFMPFFLSPLSHGSLRSRHCTAWKAHICTWGTGSLLVRQLWVLRHVLVLMAWGQVKSQAPIMWLPSVKVGCLKEYNRKIRNVCTLFPFAIGTELEFYPTQVPVMLGRSFNTTWKPRHLVLPFIRSHDSSPYPTHLWDESGFPRWRLPLCGLLVGCISRGSKMFMV